MKTFNEIENALRDYSWMIKEIQRLKDELNDVKANEISKYGIESILPKNDRINKPVESEVINRDRRIKTLKKFEEKVNFIEKHSSSMEDDRELTVLNCLLDGMTILEISRHIGLSERKIYMLKDEIINHMSYCGRE